MRLIATFRPLMKSNHHYRPHLSPAMSSSNGNKANSTIQIAMARLEDEFRNILLNHTSPIEPDSIDSTTASADPGSTSRSSSGTPTAELDDHLSEEDLAVGSGLVWPLAASPAARPSRTATVWPRAGRMLWPAANLELF